MKTETKIRLLNLALNLYTAIGITLLVVIDKGCP